MITRAEATDPTKIAETEHQENILILEYSPDLLKQLSSFIDEKRGFEAILIDATVPGFLFPTEVLIETAKLIGPLLAAHGNLAFLISDRAVVFYKGSLMGNLSFIAFENYAEVYDYSPSLHKHVQEAPW